MKRNTAILYWIMAGVIAFLLLMNLSNEKYRIFTDIKLEESAYEENVLCTHRLALPAGRYRIVMNYGAHRDVPVKICAGHDEIGQGILQEEENGAYFESYVTVEKDTDLFHFEFGNAGEGALELYNYEIFSEKPIIYDSVYMAVFFLVLALVYFLLAKYGVVSKADRRTQTVFLVSAGLIIFTSYPLFTGYLVYSHDLGVHLMRIEGVKSALQDGQFLAAIYPECNNGYGLLGFMYPSLFLYFPALLRLFHVSMVASYQFLLLMINLSTAFVAYFSVRSITKEDYPSLMAAVLYMLAPYRLCNLYFRGALGEVTAMVFLPLVVAGIYNIFMGEKKKWYLLAFGYTGILQSHMLSCLMVAFLSVGLGIFLVKYIFDGKRYLALGKALLLFLVMNGGFLMALFRFSEEKMGIGTILNNDFYEDAVYPGQFLMTKASSGYTEKLSYGIHDELSLSIGMIGGITILILIFYLMCYQKREEINRDCSHTFIVVLTCICAALLFGASTLFPWKGLAHIGPVRKLLSTIQFSFRFLGIVSALLAVACGIAIARTEALNRYRRELFLIILVAGLLGGAEIMDEYATQEVYITKYDGGFSECRLPEYWPGGTDGEMFADTNPWASNVKISGYKKDGTKTDFSYVTSGKGDFFVDLPLLYYPGYYATDEDGEDLLVTKGERNRVRVCLRDTEEQKKVSVRYSLRISLKRL